MSTKYCDHGAYGAYAATPTWGVPQEGDGAAKAASTASATISLDMTGWVFNSTTSKVSVMGATDLNVTTGANSATNILYSATLTTMIDNIVTVLNTLATATIVNKPTGWAAPQIRNAVFAKRTGNVLEVMTRTGSADWNTRIGIAFTAVTNATSGTWANGESGCYGYLFNPSATIWPQAIAKFGYGLWAAALPNAGNLVAGDVIKVRANKTIFTGDNLGGIVGPASMGSLSGPIRFDIDDGTEWPADGATPVLRITVSASLGGGYGFGFGGTTSTAAYMNIVGVRYAGGNSNLTFEAFTTGAQTNYAYISIQTCTPVRFDSVDFIALGTPATTSSWVSAAGAAVSAGAFQSASFVGCKFVWPGQSTALINMGSGGYNYRADFYGCEFKATGMVTATTFCVTLFNNSTHRLLLDSCKFTGFVTGSRLFTASSTTTGNNTAILRNCSLGNVNVLGPNTLTSAAGELEAGERGVFITSQYGYHEFIYERSGRVYVEWVYAKSRPTLNAVLDDGVTPWCIYAVPTTVAAQIGKMSPVEIPLIGKKIPANGDLTQAVRTLTLNFLLESTVTWTKQDVSVVVTYSNTDGTVAIVDTYDPDAAALDTSTAAWSTTSWSGLTWNKKKFEITTPTAVLSSSQIGIVVRFHTAASADTTGIIIDPEVLVT